MNRREAMNMRALAVAVAVVCLGLRSLTIGWFGMIGIFLYPLIALVHCVVHWIALPEESVAVDSSGDLQLMSPSTTAYRLSITSNALLLLAFLVQLDLGDGPSNSKWMTILGRDTTSFDVSDRFLLAFNFVVFLPAAIMWTALLRQHIRDERTNHASLTRDG